MAGGCKPPFTGHGGSTPVGQAQTAVSDDAAQRQLYQNLPLDHQFHDQHNLSPPGRGLATCPCPVLVVEAFNSLKLGPLYTIISKLITHTHTKSQRMTCIYSSNRKVLMVATTIVFIWQVMVVFMGIMLLLT